MKLKDVDCAGQPAIKYKIMKVEKCTVFSAILGILLYFADIISDLSLAGNYYNDGHVKFFWLTLSLVVLSAVVSSVFSLYMYWIDSKDEELKVSKTNWIVRAVFLLCGIAPVLRNFDSLWFALKSCECKDENKKQYYARRMIFEINDGSFLRLFEAFIESGPQLILQIYIFMEMQALSPDVFTTTEIWQCCTMLISVISISGTIMAYSSSLRSSLDHKNDLRWFLLPPFFLWRFFEITSRVIAMGLGVSASPYFHIAFFIHFIVMAVWIYFLKTDFCDDRCAEKLYNALMGIVLTFVFLNPEDSPTRKRCTLFYLGMFAENTFLMAFWFYTCASYTSLRVPAMIIQISSFFLGIVFMIAYYTICHPTVGKLFKEKNEESNNLQNISETCMRNGEANAMLEMRENYETGETVVQDGGASAMSHVLQENGLTESQTDFSNVQHFQAVIHPVPHSTPNPEF